MSMMEQAAINNTGAFTSEKKQRRPTKKQGAPSGDSRWTVCKLCRTEIDSASEEVQWGRWKMDDGPTLIGYAHASCVTE